MEPYKADQSARSLVEGEGLAGGHFGDTANYRPPKGRSPDTSIGTTSPLRRPKPPEHWRIPRSDAVEMLNADLCAGGPARVVALSFGSTFVHTGDSLKRCGVAASTDDPTEDPALRLTAEWQAILEAAVMAAVAAAQRNRSTMFPTFHGPVGDVTAAPPAETRGDYRQPPRSTR